jgi:phage gp29-like protein
VPRTAVGAVRAVRPELVPASAAGIVPPAAAVSVSSDAKSSAARTAWTALNDSADRPLVLAIRAARLKNSRDAGTSASASLSAHVTIIEDILVLECRGLLDGML